MAQGTSTKVESAAGPESMDPIPLRMLNEYAYCPRLFHLMHVEGRWADNRYTIEGRYTHRRVDKLDHVLPGRDADSTKPARDAGSKPQRTDQQSGGEPADEASIAEESPGDEEDPGEEGPDIVRSIPLGSESLGLSAKLDLVSLDDAADPPEAVPVETKRGRVPDTPERSYEPERVQLMAQGLLLREHGYHCDHGVLYFAGSRARVEVPFTPKLERRTRELLAEAHAAAESRELPPPLEDSPKCNGCSLAGICLPDETLALRQVPEDSATLSVRRLYPMREEAAPLYVQEQGARIGKRGASLVIKQKGEQLATARLKDVSQLILCGNIQISTQTLHQLCEAGVPVVYLSTGHWFYGVTLGMGLKNAFDRAAQFRAVGEPARCLTFARRLIADKGINQRAVLRRNGTAPTRVGDELADLIQRARTADSIASLLGIEGALARAYFAHFATMFRSRDLSDQWDFEGRNRRPPRDPVNAMLSFAYAMLTKECAVALMGEGLEPHWGLYHQPRHGRPALALDLMEPLRPLIADSAVITAINTGMVRARHFKTGPSGCILQPAGRKALITAFEGRLDQLVTHPAFNYRCAWRAAIRLHARLLARWFRGDVPDYASITTR